MNEKCPRCDEYRLRGSNFCGGCGKFLDQSAVSTPEPSKENRGFLRTVMFICSIFVAFVALFELATLIIHMPEIWFFLSEMKMYLFLLLPSPTAIFAISALELQIYWMLVVAAILASAIYAFWKLIEALRNKDAHYIESSEKTSMFWISVGISFTLVLNFIIVYIVLLTGQDVTTPGFTSVPEQMFAYANAAVWEEIVTRVLYIGVPMTVLSLIITKKKDSLKCLFGGFGMSLSAIIFIIISGVVFGLAHYSGWDEQMWKVVTACIMGVFMGYVFVRFGLYATILMHFINNYLSSFDWMGVGGLEVMVTFTLIAFGIVASLYLIKKFIGSDKRINSVPLFHNGYVKDR